MEIIVAKNSGFCNGVNYTVKKANELLENNEKLYCLGEIVHNEGVIKNLEDKGLILINNIDEAPDFSNVIFRAHGESLEVYEKAKSKNINVIDLTCGKVKIIHNKVLEKSKDNFIIIIGKKEHPEIIGTKGHAGNNSIVITDVEEVKNAYVEFKKSSKDKVYICCQTTFSVLLFNEIIDEIVKVFNGVNLSIDNTICDSTTNRQEEVKLLSKEVDVVVVIGGKKSSNTKELYNIALKNCNEVYIIQDIEDVVQLKQNLCSKEKIAVVSGASTPEDVVSDIVNEIKKIS